MKKNDLDTIKKVMIAWLSYNEINYKCRETSVPSLAEAIFYTLNRSEKYWLNLYETIIFTEKKRSIEMKKKRRNFDKLAAKCNDMSVCECGITEMCDNQENADRLCEKEYCPKWNINEKSKN
jgi:hypothetical protein